MSFLVPNPPPRRRNTRRNSTYYSESSNPDDPNETGSENEAPPLPRTPFTPYKNRHQSLHHLQVLPNSDITKACKKLKYLLNSSWLIYQVSPLYNWNYDEIHRKRYQRCMRDTLTATTPNSDCSYQVEYSVVNNLRCSDADPDAIEVTVNSVTGEDIYSTVYRGIFISWNSQGVMLPNNVTYLPLLFCKGQQGMIHKVHRELERIHDCVIANYKLQNEDLRTLTVGVLANKTTYGEESVQFAYIFPTHPKIGYLSLTLPMEIMSKLWSCIHKSGPLKWTSEEMKRMWSELESHLKVCYCIDFEKGCLQSVRLPHVAFTYNKIHAKTRETMNFILSYLMSECVPLETANPSLHQELTSSL